MTQDGQESEALYRGLLSAFPNEGELERMLRFGMGLNLAEIASGNLSDQVFEVIRFAETRGLLDQLVHSAVAANPGNPDLRAAAELHSQNRAVSGQASAKTAREAVAKIDKIALRKVIQDSYSLEELQVLCADLEERLKARGQDLHVSLDDVGGGTKAVKVLNLIEFLDRRRLLDVLVHIVREQRPGTV